MGDLKSPRGVGWLNFFALNAIEPNERIYYHFKFRVLKKNFVLVVVIADNLRKSIYAKGLIELIIHK